MLTMVESRIRGGMCNAVYRNAEANNKNMKIFDENSLSTYLEYLDANNLHEWARCKKLPVSSFIWAEDLSIFTEKFVKNYDENSDA